jgi:hypothetical protein
MSGRIRSALMTAGETAGCQRVDNRTDCPNASDVRHENLDLADTCQIFLCCI